MPHQYTPSTVMRNRSPDRRSATDSSSIRSAPSIRETDMTRRLSPRASSSSSSTCATATQSVITPPPARGRPSPGATASPPASRCKTPRAQQPRPRARDPESSPTCPLDVDQRLERPRHRPHLLRDFYQRQPHGLQSEGSLDRKSVV